MSLFDITQEAVSETADLELKRADGSPLTDGKGKQLSITMYGPGSSQYVEAQAEGKRRARSRAEKANNIYRALDGAEDDHLHFLASITASFNGWELPHPDKGQWKSEKEMFKAAYGTRSLGFIKEQAETFAGEWGNFSNG